MYNSYKVQNRETKNVLHDPVTELLMKKFCALLILILSIFVAGAAVWLWQLSPLNSLPQRRPFISSTSSSRQRMSPPVTVQPQEVATASLIFLHGLGDTGHGWAEQFRDFSFKHIRCVCPNAPLQPVTLNGGMVMPSWFDIQGLSPNSSEDADGIKEASEELQRLVEKEVSNGIPHERIVIGGFSQGGSVALYTAFGTDTKVGGVLGLSTWLPLSKYFTSDSNPKYNQNVPVLLCHGLADPLVPYKWGQATHEVIKSFNSKAVLKSYRDLAHSSSIQEMEDVKAFLEDVLKEKS